MVIKRRGVWNKTFPLGQFMLHFTTFIMFLCKSNDHKSCYLGSYLIIYSISKFMHFKNIHTTVQKYIKYHFDAKSVGKVVETVQDLRSWFLKNTVSLAGVYHKSEKCH